MGDLTEDTPQPQFRCGITYLVTFRADISANTSGDAINKLGDAIRRCGLTSHDAEEHDLDGLPATVTVEQAATLAHRLSD